MKKIFIFIALTSLTAWYATAQDTVDFNYRDSNYLYYNWPDDIDSNNPNIWWGVSTMSGTNKGEYGHNYYTPDSLTIYGLAAGVLDMLNIYGAAFPYRVADTSYENAFEYMRLYEVVHIGDTDTLSMLREAKLHLHHTPINYHIKVPKKGENSYWYIPMYELFFDSSITMIDTFYIGQTRHIKAEYIDPKTGVKYESQYPPVWLSAFYIYDGSAEEPFYNTIYIISHPHETYTTWLRSSVFRDRLFLFPILTPNPDTTTVDTTGVGIRRVEDRLVGVMPNPATKEVKVVSSFGLRHIDAYDAAGRRVLSRDAQGLQAHIDVGDWPRGAYTLHILTPAGTTVKKLLVE